MHSNVEAKGDVSADGKNAEVVEVNAFFFQDLDRIGRQRVAAEPVVIEHIHVVDIVAVADRIPYIAFPDQVVYVVLNIVRIQEMVLIHTVIVDLVAVQRGRRDHEIQKFGGFVLFDIHDRESRACGIGVVLVVYVVAVQNHASRDIFGECLKVFAVFVDHVHTGLRDHTSYTGGGA